MQHEVTEYVKKYVFLAEYTQLSPLISKLMSQSIQWCNRMPAVLEEHQTIIAKKSIEFQEALKVSLE